MPVQGMDWDTLSGKPYLSSLFQSLVPGSLQSLSPFRCLCHTANLQAVHHWFNWLLYPKWELNLKAVMFEVTPSTILFYFRVPDLTLLSPGICPSNRRGSHTAVCQKRQQTEASRQLSYPLPRRNIPASQESPPGNVMACGVQYWVGTQKVTDTISPVSQGLVNST